MIWEERKGEGRERREKVVKGMEKKREHKGNGKVKAWVIKWKRTEMGREKRSRGREKGMNMTKGKWEGK